jgi:hypothetical protein
LKKKESIVPFRDVLDPNSEFWEACGRHTNRHTSRKIQAVYLCDECAVRLTNEAFNGRPPIYHGETVCGYCGLCNAKKTVTARFWFACDICWNVVQAYQRSKAACEAVWKYWSDCCATAFPALQLVETEPVYLAPYQRGGKTKRSAAETLDTLDFLVKPVGGSGDPLFHIELKSGPGAIEQMSEFQLDINDSNDIVGVANKTGLPVYIFHVELRHVYAAPTRATVHGGMWWTDIFTLLDNRRAVRHRRGEDKQAGYYSPAAFRPIDSFLEEIKSGRYAKLTERLVRKPLDFT